MLRHQDGSCMLTGDSVHEDTQFQ